MRPVVFAAALSLLSLAAPRAHAQGAPAGQAVPEAQARARLDAFNAEILRAFKALSGGFGKDPAAEKKRIDEAAQIASGIDAAMSDSLASSPAAHKTVKDNLRALKAEIENARLAQRYSAGEAAVRARHAEGQPAKAEELAALEQTLTTLREKAGPGWKGTVEHFAARLRRLQQDRAALAGPAPIATAAAKAPSVSAPPPATTTTAAAAVPQADAGLLEAFRVANRERRTVERLLEDEGGPLPPAALKSYLEAASRVSALSERAGRYYTTVYRHFLVADAFRKPDEEAFGALPSLYQGDLHGHGSAKGKLLARFSAEEGWCYAVIGRFQSFSGGEALSGLEWSAQAQGASLSRFDVPHTGPGHQVMQGVCPSEGTRMTLKAKIEGAARDNPLRYVVVGWPKESLPPFVASYMRLLPEDRCDDESWYRAWTRPVPGSLLYRGQEPWLVIDASRPPSAEVTIVNVNGERATVNKSELSSKPPKPRAFTTKFAFSGCPSVSGAGSAEADRLAKCLARVEKKFAKSVEREEGWVERATSESAREKAEARLTALKERWEAERSQQCDPLEQRLREKVKRTFDRILDLHLDNEVVVSFDRGDQLKAEQEARPDLR